METDNRTFKEIYQSMDRYDQKEFRQRVLKMSLVTESAFRNWALGNRVPEPVHQANIVRALKSFCIVATPSTLFPAA